MAALLSVLCSWFVKQVKPVRVQKDGVPLPAVPHLILTTDLLQEKDVFVVGDVHGCYDELISLLKKADVLENTETVIIFVGDLVNKGPQSYQVLQFLRKLNHRMYSVRGNHEEAVLRDYSRLKADSSYKPKNAWVWELTEEDVAFLTEIPYTIEIPHLNALIVHAGLVPGVKLESQVLKDMTHMRNLIVEDYFHGHGLHALEAIDKGDPWASLWPGPRHVYFGHDARRRLQKYPYATGLDTASVYGQSLTGMYLTGKKTMYSVKSSYNCLEKKAER